LASFHRRRIAIPAGPDDLVLDVGSGDKPHWRADVLIDRYVDAAHGIQRSGRAAARVSRPLFDADAAAMPFADGAFDYVVCSHVLEHVVDPAAVVAEMTRVGRAGYIEVPEAASAKILDFPSHLWWCRLDGSTLCFSAKTAPAFDAEIAGFIARADLERRLARLLDADFDLRVIALPWRDGVAVAVDGTLDPALVRAAAAARSHHRGGQARAARALTWGWTLPLRHGPRRIARRRPVAFDDVVAPEHRRGTGELLERRVYRL
jgi:SAM-dependent methyltransferase